jgi:hypothetical protein
MSHLVLVQTTERIKKQGRHMDFNPTPPGMLRPGTSQCQGGDAGMPPVSVDIVPLYSPRSEVRTPRAWLKDA